MTRLLGFQYLWLADALCIIQDNDEDWRRGAARMGSVYSNASLGLSATNAPNLVLFAENVNFRTTWKITSVDPGSMPSSTDAPRAVDCERNVGRCTETCMWKIVRTKEMFHVYTTGPAGSSFFGPLACFLIHDLTSSPPVSTR